ncbi:MBL fold metallo-hydrolase [Komagataeibacter medellinensis]|uniref:Outer membrane protein n=1 Tax=Komagataeibacter medellinensis (strain NBRC 3288 / BCRC 11682 / LMG 1693 / Kondo 51) TaxID=634177 RepID=G2I0M3_KOMMN|nr:MBL fold metallo-hydrolase [Komagataeibacter medellinensis]BAK84481.1 outer membrane protein [Komagataeibacter medellinensis NBRC 3288]
MPPLPASDHTDGTRFFNPTTICPEGTQPARMRRLAILKWQWNRPRSDWPRWIENPTPIGDPHARPMPGTVAVTFIGHSTFLIRVPHADGTTVTILTDPIFSKRCSPFSFIGPKRVRAPGRSLATLPRVDIVLVSHAHYDHMDLPSLRALARRGDDPLVVTPLENARFMRATGLKRIMELDWWQDVEALGTRITCTPARHGAARTPFDRNTSLWGGFMLRDTTGRQLFFAGDTADGRHWGLIRNRLGAPDLAFLPIGAYAPRTLMERVHTTPEEAVSGLRQLGAKQGIGMHFGTFRLTDEPFDEPVRRMHAAGRAQGLAPGSMDVLHHGECRALLW